MSAREFNFLFIYNANSLHNRLKSGFAREAIEVFSKFSTIVINDDANWLKELCSYAQDLQKDSNASEVRNLIILSGGDGTLHALLNALENDNLFPHRRPELLLLPMGSTNFFSIQKLDFRYNNGSELGRLVKAIENGEVQAKTVDEHIMCCAMSNNSKKLYGFNISGLAVASFNERYLLYKLKHEKSRSGSKSDKNHRGASQRFLLFYVIGSIFRFIFYRKLYEFSHKPKRGFFNRLFRFFIGSGNIKDTAGFEDVDVKLRYQHKEEKVLMYAFWLSAFPHIRLNNRVRFHFTDGKQSSSSNVYFCSCGGICNLFRVAFALLNPSGYYGRKAAIYRRSVDELRLKGIKKISFDGETYSFDIDTWLTLSKPFKYRFWVGV